MLTPKKLTPEQLSKMKESIRNQKPTSFTPKTTDGKGVFSIPVNGKVIVYVPDNTFVNERGEQELLMDNFYVHTISRAGSVKEVRCTRGIEGYNSCPYCDSMQTHWDFVRANFERACEAQGLDPTNMELDEVRSIWRRYRDDMAVKAPALKHTFPIVVFPDIKDLDDKGVPKHEVVWYTVGDYQWNEKWGATMKSIKGLAEDVDIDGDPNNSEDFVINPAGRFFTLDYTYDTKGKEATILQSAMNMKVQPLKGKYKVGNDIVDLNSFKKMFDEECAAWTPEVAMSTIARNIWYEEEDMQKDADEVTIPVRQRLELMSDGVEMIGSENLPKQIASNESVSEEVAELQDIDDFDDSVFDEIG